MPKVLKFMDGKQVIVDLDAAETHVEAAPEVDPIEAALMELMSGETNTRKAAVLKKLKGQK